MRAFILTCAARVARGDGAQHNSMLIHVTRFVDVQSQVAELVGLELSGLQNRIRYGDGESPTHSNRRERLYVKRRKVHARIVQIRNDNHHKATTAIAKSAGRVVVETLNVSGMLRNRRLAQRPSPTPECPDSWPSWNTNAPGTAPSTSRRTGGYASSKLCSHCGWKNDDLTLSDREWSVRRLWRC